MIFSGWFPSDEGIAAAIGMSGPWQMVTYPPATGYLLWYGVAFLLFVTEVLIPRLRVSFLMMAAISAGVVVKLAEVYEWGIFSFGEQIVMFVLLAVVMFAIGSTARRAIPETRTGNDAEGA